MPRKFIFIEIGSGGASGIDKKGWRWSTMTTADLPPAKLDQKIVLCLLSMIIKGAPE
jgi:hypothetical protein